MSSGDKSVFLEVSPQEFLAAVRRDLGLATPRPPLPPHPEERPGLEGQRQQVRAINERLAARRGELLEQLAGRAESSGWKVLRAADDEEGCRQALALAAELGVKRVAATALPVLERLSLLARLREAGIEVTVVAASDGSPRDALRQAVAASDLGVSGVDYALAETGSCVLLPRRGVSRLVSLLSPTYLALVEPAQVVETLDDLLALRRLAFLEEGRLGSYMSIITGPSRTADIEQTLVVGAHGPRQAYMLIVGTA